MDKEIRKKLPKKNKLSLKLLIPLGMTALAVGYGIGQLINQTKINNGSSGIPTQAGTPGPGTSDRNNISICLEDRKESDCVKPISLESTLNQIANFSAILMNSKSEISENSFNTITNSAKTVYNSITGYLNNEPGSIEFFANESIFPEADGGSSINHWQLATATPNVLTPAPYQTPITISIKPEEHLYLPQIEYAGQGDLIINVDNIRAIGTRFHEWFHTDQAIEYWKMNGTFNNKKEPYSTSRYTANYDKEEYEAEFYGDVAQMAILKKYGLLDKYYEGFKNDKGQNVNGIDLASIAYFLDQNGVTPDNPIWPLLYDVTSAESIKYNTEMFQLTGDKKYQDQINETMSRWQNYPWTKEEVELVKKLIDQGTAEGWIFPDSIPPLPEPASAEMNLADQLFKTALQPQKEFAFASN